MLATTTPTIEGKRITKYYGIVFRSVEQPKTTRNTQA